MTPDQLAMSGVKVYRSENAFPRVWRQVRRPRSKCKRIRKKWRKDLRNWAMVDDGPQMWQTPWGLVVNETAWLRIQRMIAWGAP